MFKLLMLMALLVVIYADPLQLNFDNAFNDRIVGGHNVTIEEVPYQVSLQLYDHHHCGGSIYSDHWVLTAAHCVRDHARAYTVRAGSTLHNDGGSLHKVAEIIQHERFGMGHHQIPENDIALVRVEEPFVFDETRRPIELYEDHEESVPGAISIVTGWGTTLGESPLVLQAVQLPIVSKEDCWWNHFSHGGISDTEICAGYPEGGKDSCESDSGGPLAIDGRQAGIVSWGYRCAQPKKPGVYAEVAFYREWIKEHSGI